jgi:hypothetical protein
MKANPTIQRGDKSSPSSDACRDRHRKLLATVESARIAISREFRWTVTEHEHLARLALNEAEAIAWQTGFPHLTFPALAEEKVRAVATWSRRQRSFHRRSPSIKVSLQRSTTMPSKTSETFFLASAKARYITGTVIPVDGGLPEAFIR